MKNSINYIEILSRLKHERIKKNMTQEELAEILGCSPKTISDIETGRRNPSFKMFINICYVFHADINYIIFGEKNNK
ncbi:helix-turn-helix domain-containing protein [Marinitoga sp. 1138]|uniref:helix-turn-helix domain-containing protein n=1 Tax=Marinitoga sp. 1138 TaxID=1643334 RepID=UPI0015865D41|nr:helix-turn-helix transcriptional regulator [Marinitoga sp. 1138]NUU96863.1 hypothetical protein [Marinitoga sp. 1138]